VAMPSTDTNGYTDNVNTAAKLFMEYGDFIRAVIRCQVKNETKVDDLFQDFFLSLVANPLPADVRNTKNYLYRAITNDIINAVQRAENYQNKMLKYAKRFNHSINKKTPEDVVIKSEETNKMFELIEMRLRRSEAQAITFRYRNNYNIKEVAMRMNVNSSSVRKYIYVGLSKIRQLLKLTGGDDNDRSKL
jgi:RNA polymerase sigma factor (sigma-70 family)